MADETTATEPVAAEPEVQATQPEAPKPEPTPAPQEPDYRAAYVGLQRTVNKLHSRNEDILRQNRELASAVETIKVGQSAVLRQTLGEDEAKALEARQIVAQQQAASMEAAKAAEQYIVSQTELVVGMLQAAGIDPRDAEIDWASDASNVQEWKQRVLPSITARIQKQNAEIIRRHSEASAAKSKKEITEEAAALAQRQLKESGVDRIDTAKGTGSTSLAQRIRDMDANSPEFAKMLNDAKAGRLAI